VLLLDDCLTSYCEPGVNRSAVELLEAAGYVVERANLWCCGRPFISKGLLDPAKALVRRNVAILDEFARENIPILGVEPSCLLTLVDEYPDLFPSEATQRVKQQAHLLDGWLASRIRAGEVSLQFRPRSGEVLLHGHCQQKALVGTQGTRQALGLVPGLTVREVDSGCCGMAGSFGYEHYDVSQQIGERVLFPAVREHASQTGEGSVCAPGFSCRHQVLDGTGHRPLHPVELLREQLVEDQPKG
jgi:Fe-S oxidoreductase